MTPQRTLPADVYDALELSALAYGGIGARWMTDMQGNPRCIYGHACFLDGNFFSGPVHNALCAAGIRAVYDNDEAVLRVMHDREKRIPFRRWCKELHVVRGE